MATTSKYYVLNPGEDNKNFLDFELRYGNITTAGASIQYNGSPTVDSVFVRPGLNYDLTNSGTGTDKIYFAGNFADYGLAFDSATLALLITQAGQSGVVRVAGSSDDSLIFANGTVNARNLAAAVKASDPLPAISPTETSLNPQGAAVSTTLAATIKAYSTNTAGLGKVGETFASTKPGIDFIVNGGNAIDTVYVADGATVDASALGGSVDLIYLRGKWSDYDKRLESDNTKIVFTRNVNGFDESVTVFAGNTNVYDKLIFADGAVTTANAKISIAIDPTDPITTVPGVDPGTTTPLYTVDQVAAAIKTISDAAGANSASLTTPITPAADVYTIAGVTGVDGTNLAAIDSALNTAGVDKPATDTAAKIQDLVDAYKAILSSADGQPNNTSTPLTADEYTAIGVTGVTGTPDPATALKLLDSAVDAKTNAEVGTAAQVQAVADAAKHVMDAAGGGSPTQIAALTPSDLIALGITGGTADNLPALVAAIAALPDANVDSIVKLQAVVDTAAAAASDALAKIAAAAGSNNAVTSGLAAAVYAAAGVTGVAANLAPINTALDSAAITSTAADTTSKVQAIVNAYNAILASADGGVATTTTALTADQYTAMGVTGVSGPVAAGTAMFLLDNVVDGKLRDGVDTQSEVQALANAANHVINAAGGDPALIAALTLKDFEALGVSNVTADNLPAILAAIGKVAPDSAIDQLSEVQAVVNTTATAASTALDTIKAAAIANNAINTGLAAATFAAAGVTGVDSTNLTAIDMALDSAAVDGSATSSAALVQGIVNSYRAILASADGTVNTTPPLTGQQYLNIGVTGIPAGLAVDGNVIALLDNVVDGKMPEDVNTVAKMQALADAANHVLGAAGGSTAEKALLTLADLTALGITGVTPENLAAVKLAIGAVSDDAKVDTKGELQQIVNAAGTGASTALTTIKNAAEANNAASTPLSAPTYLAAGVTGVDASNLAAINTALDSGPITGTLADTAAKVQIIVDAYKAILASADGGAATTTTPLTAAQYAAIGVTGVSGTAGTTGTPLFLLDNVVDGKLPAGVDTQSEVQALADAANHVLNAAGGDPAQIAALTLKDLQALGFMDVTADQLPAVIAAIGKVAPDNAIDELSEVQAVVNGAVAAAKTALGIITQAAQDNNALNNFPALTDYTAAGVTGVSSGNQASINSALDSAPVNGVATDSAAKVQGIVSAYNAILAAADELGNGNGLALTSAQYTAIGVTGVTGTSDPATLLHLLDSVVDVSKAAAVDSVDDLQAMVAAAGHVLGAAGGSTAEQALLTLADLTALGITGVTPENLAAVKLAIGAVSDDAKVDTKGELQQIVNAAGTGASTALTTIKNAAEANNAASTPLSAPTYLAAGVTGVDASNLAAINTALDSGPITGTLADTAAKVQIIVDAYKAILASADGGAATTTTPLTAAQYAAIGVTGVSGTAGTTGTPLFLLDNVVDGKLPAGVDTQSEVQALADAANHVLNAAGGDPAQIAALTLKDLQALGFMDVTADQLPAVIAAIGKVAPDNAIDELSEVQAVVNGAVAAAKTALGIITQAAQDNNALNNFPALTDYTAAGVTGVSSGNQASINSALDSAPVNGVATDSAAKVQGIVSAYNAILAAADELGNGNGLALTSAQYTAVGVTGVTGTSAPGNVLHLLDSVVDVSKATAVDMVEDLQAMVAAAGHVLTGAAGGVAPTLAELKTLGITGVDSSNLAAVQAAIAATDNTGVEVDTQSALQNIVTATVNSHPVISTTLANVTNLDVTSNLVLSANQSITIGTGTITITDMGGGTGYQNDTNTNHQTIDVATAVQSGLLTITGTGADTKIIINPTFDLDLSSNYMLAISDGAFRNAGGTQDALPFAAVTFSTVTPGVHTTGGTAATEAQASQTMSNSTGGLVASKFWLDIQGLSSANSSVTQLGALGSDTSEKAYALVMKNYATAPGGDPLTTDGDGSDGMAARDTHVSVTRFGADDVIYLDAQLNDPTKQRFDGNFSQMINGSDFGGLPGQSALSLGTVAQPVQQAGSANVWLGFEGNAGNTVYGQIYTIGTDIGWANVWHPLSAPVVMG